MQTNFTLAQLADPAIEEANRILRKCVHCGFCTATCPTYVLLGDELDGPRGRIYQMREMMQSGGPAPASVVKHVDRCLSCLSCMTTCPSGVNYMHLVDHARVHIERTYRRPLAERMLRRMLALVLPYPAIFRLALRGAVVGRPFAALLPGRLKAMAAMAPKRVQGPSPVDRPQIHPAQGPRRGRVALMAGCAQRVLAPGINEATIRLLTRHGVEVVVAKGAGCCGALVHHMGQEAAAHAQAGRNVRAWVREFDEDGLDAVIINTSGCGTTVKDYGFLLGGDAALAGDAARVSAITRDITEYMAELGLEPAADNPVLRVAYHSACSMQHGQKITEAPKQLLQQAGYRVLEAAEAHLCCGSAGTYNLLQPEIATKLRDRKVANLEAMGPEVIATGNVGCMTQIATGTGIPVVHTVELLDWATGGPAPAILAQAGPGATQPLAAD
ncbi:MAG: glycolate oxidase subunit GlcF [Alphaproteobacteria bacterium]|jgi:glycolate oxidase iron-sulfur subunit|nr:glycolate oxidase subunit GlcF [Alphaproteobacteria bacterium]